MMTDIQASKRVALTRVVLHACAHELHFGFNQPLSIVVKTSRPEVFFQLRKGFHGVFFVQIFGLKQHFIVQMLFYVG